jgi:cell cycle protein
MISSCILFVIFQALFVIQGKEDAMDEEEEEQQAPKGKRRRAIYE